ncbi:hypothetical protein GQF61_07825 [Sphingobacterium sp. DK4209]|uniref:O-antigen ligase-related domain-containing protein n=1 Tax=Sphingobacterium zhuxiongii TaxID=2662364 RepID=A0A5Q0QJI5_9SPHI|nr:MULTISPECIES: O-antigen ligase family protein [unclassified Sphingobacterium]MVZ65764.1 hypothetical protein [Sphingobacterium sp. DK4209]QGA27960.1 hypothetical protein GFH32_17215 [Sphingobacterium sp. dk4302]
MKKIYNILNILFVASLFALGPTMLFAVPNYLFIILLVVSALFIISDRLYLRVLSNKEVSIQIQFALILLITAMLSRYADEALAGFLSFFIACVMGIFSSFLIKDENDFKRILTAITVGGFILVVFYMRSASLSALQTRQLTEGVLSLNSFSHTIIISFCAGFMLLNLSISKPFKFLIIGILFVFFIALILSGSRQSLVTILTLFVVYIVVKSLLLKKGGIKNILIGVVALISVGYFLMLYGSDTVLLKRMAETNVEEDERFELITIAFELFLNSPIIGHGIGTFKYYNDFYVYTHNTFLELLFVGGILSLFLFLKGHYSLVKFIFLGKFPNLGLSAASIAVLISFIISGQFFIFYDSKLALILFFSIIYFHRNLYSYER